MQPSKKMEEIRECAAKLEKRLREMMGAEMKEFGNICDQLRVVGYVGEAMCALAEANLARLKFEHDEEVKRMVKIYEH